MISIGVVNSKGGVGKTTLSTSLAVRAAKDYPRVALVDLDPMQGSTRWFKLRSSDTNPTLFVGESLAADAIDSLEQTGWDIVIFDGAPGSLELTEEAISAVDFVLIPLKASDQDTSSTEYPVSACMETDKEYLLVINEAVPVKGGDKRAIEVREALAAVGQPIAKTMIHRRVAYVDAVNVGKSASELNGSGAATASKEIDALWSEIMKRLTASTKEVGR